MQKLFKLIVISIFYPIYIKFMGRDSLTFAELLVLFAYLIFFLKFEFSNRTKKKICCRNRVLLLIIISFISTIFFESNFFYQSLRQSLFFSISLIAFLLTNKFNSTLSYRKKLTFIDDLISLVIILISIEVFWAGLIYAVPQSGKILAFFAPRNITDITIRQSIINPTFRVRGIVLMGEELGESLSFTFPLVIYKVISNKRFVYKVIMFIYFLGMVMSATRSALILFVLSSILFLLYYSIRMKKVKKTAQFLLYISIVVFLLLSYFSVFVSNLEFRVEETINAYYSYGASYETLNRTRFYDVVNMVMNNLNFLGNGMYITSNGFVYNFHNLYLNLIYKIGILGFILVISIFFTVIFRLFKSFKIKHLKINERLFVFSMLLSLFVLLVNEFKFEFNRGPNYQLIVWIIIGLYYAYANTIYRKYL